MEEKATPEGWRDLPGSCARTDERHEQDRDAQAPRNHRSSDDNMSQWTAGQAGEYNR